MADTQLDDAPRRARRDPAESPVDRFETPGNGGRVGAHRLIARQRRFWQYLVAAVIGIALLSGAGIFVLLNTGTDTSSFFEGGKSTPKTPQVTPDVDPDATVAVLNGSGTDGLQDEVASAITAGKWGTIGFSDVAASRDVKISAVFYGAAADQAAALGLAAELGGVQAYQSKDYAEFGVQLVVLLGDDYAGPGAERQTKKAATDGASDGAPSDGTDATAGQDATAQ